MLEGLIITTYWRIIVPLISSLLIALITFKFDNILLNILSFAGFIVYLTLMILLGGSLIECVLYAIPLAFIYIIKSILWRKKHDI